MTTTPLTITNKASKTTLQLSSDNTTHHLWAKGVPLAATNIRAGSWKLLQTADQSGMTIFGATPHFAFTRACLDGDPSRRIL